MTNAGRDPPEPGVATWVSANDKPSAAAAKPAPGDETEKRIKTEVMALPARERHRIKTIHDEPFDAFNQTMMDYHTARQIRAPETVPASAGGMNKMNLDLEIRKRYAQPLFSETFEFPDQDSISARITPICYEEGLANGATTGCSEIINVATEYYIKEVIAAVYFPTRSAALKTALSTPSQKSSQKQQNSRGKRGAGKGPSRYPVKSNGGGRTGPITIEEFRLAMELGTGGTSNVPIPFAQMLLAQHEQFDYSSTTAYDPPPAAKPLAIVPGADAQTDAMVADEAEGETDNLGWRGSSARDRQKLVGVLDDCLAVRL
ncbi:transcriptional regulator of RNA polII, SAGA, subunit-domain-containing protein [Lineolata rhizophorae]|uniref:Transcriptional regulator of RNA polII, SAGA, subunit-domain-containing protein n=1 Tax=Lineolata rhizophorae TaxID=578093 RepID=A0A6A6NU94_9PEZI|nr:transcriptional regulator of RNA polII, SAGA, subunit-domain-containing protein [Lineolata rhizophorae]